MDFIRIKILKVITPSKYTPINRSPSTKRHLETRVYYQRAQGEKRSTLPGQMESILLKGVFSSGLGDGSVERTLEVQK